jgi:hypothetical protein
MDGRLATFPMPLAFPCPRPHIKPRPRPTHLTNLRLPLPPHPLPPCRPAAPAPGMLRVLCCGSCPPS